MEPAAEQLEVVGGHERGADRDEREDPERLRDRDRDPDRRARRDRDDRQRDEHPGRDARPQRPSVELVERVRADAHREREREHGEPERPPGDDGREAAADDDVREVPGRVRRVQQRDVVAPAAAPERVERGAPGGSCAPSPDDDAAAEAHPALRDVGDPGVAARARAARPRGIARGSRGSTDRGSGRPRASPARRRDPRAAGRRPRRGPTAAARARAAVRTRASRPFRPAGRRGPARRGSRPGRRRSAGGT